MRSFCEHLHTVRERLAQHTGPKDRRCFPAGKDSSSPSRRQDLCCWVPFAESVLLFGLVGRRCPLARNRPNSLTRLAPYTMDPVFTHEGRELQARSRLCQQEELSARLWHRTCTLKPQSHLSICASPGPYRSSHDFDGDMRSAPQILTQPLMVCRQHLRKCQCRRKTPPCKNCPTCRTHPDLMAISEPALQHAYCTEHLHCAICACPYVLAFGVQIRGLEVQGCTLDLECPSTLELER